MSKHWDETDILKQIFESRLAQQTTSTIVLSQLLGRYDFGQSAVHKSVTQQVFGNPQPSRHNQ